MSVAFASTFPLVVACAGADAGAGDDDDDDDDDDGPPGGPDVEAFADAAIAFFERCFTPETFLGEFVATAEPTFAENTGFGEFDRQDFIDNFNQQNANPAFELNREKFDRCIDLLPTISCDEVFAGGDGQAFADCNFFEGARATGEGCASEAECADETQLCEGASFGEECGTCTAPPGEGDPCPDFQCGPDLACDGDTETCVRLPGAGEPCVDFECAGPLDCNDANICEEPGPAPPNPELGDPCLDGSCNLFQTGLACDDTDTCVQAVVVQPGDPCDPGQGERYCVDQFSGNACVDPEADGVFECVVLPGPGQPCVDFRCNNAVAECNFDTEQCDALPGEGEPCESSCLADFECNDAGVCVAAEELENLVCPA